MSACWLNASLTPPWPHVDDLCASASAGVHAHGAWHRFAQPSPDRRLCPAALRAIALPHDAQEVGVVERRRDEDRALALRFGLERGVGPFVRDDDRQVGVIQAAADGQLQAVSRPRAWTSATRTSGVTESRSFFASAMRRRRPPGGRPPREERQYATGRLDPR